MLAVFEWELGKEDEFVCVFEFMNSYSTIESSFSLICQGPDQKSSVWIYFVVEFPGGSGGMIPDSVDDCSGIDCFLSASTPTDDTTSPSTLTGGIVAAIFIPVVVTGVMIVMVTVLVIRRKKKK